MECFSCNSNKVVTYSGKVSDLCCTVYKGQEVDSYPVPLVNVASGDYIRFSVCLSCSKIQQSFSEAQIDEFESSFKEEFRDHDSDDDDDESEDDG